MPPLTKRRLLDQIELNDHEKKNLQILDTIRKKGPIARAEISRLIGLNIVTVTSYIDQYIKKGVIKEVGIDVSSGGRKPTLVAIGEGAEPDPLGVQFQHHAALGALGLKLLVFIQETLSPGLRDTRHKGHGRGAWR